MIAKKLKDKLQQRISDNSLRSLPLPNDLIDFSSNDYLGFSNSQSIFERASRILLENDLKMNGATGSRLLSGNHKLYDLVEHQLCQFHDSEAALIFNSGYDANLGFFSTVPQRNDIILYDELIHASIRDGLQLSLAKSFKFLHNDLENLERLLERHTEIHSKSNDEEKSIYVVTESVFSMDGDNPDLERLSTLCEKFKSFLIVDEAHAVGVLGKGKGLVFENNLQNKIFARIITFGKAIGCHGAAILASEDLRDYLINFSRPLIYTTALPPNSLASIKASYEELEKNNYSGQMQTLSEKIKFFQTEVKNLKLDQFFVKSESAIHSFLLSGNETVKAVSKKLRESGFDVKPILSPTVPKDEERLRFCIHSFNTQKEISEVLELLSIFVKDSLGQ